MMLVEMSDYPNIKEERVLMFGTLMMNMDRHEVKADGKPLRLTLSEFRLLKALLKRPGIVHTREELLRFVSGEVRVVARNIDVHIYSLRKKLNQQAQSIETIRGVGYRLLSGTS